MGMMEGLADMPPGVLRIGETRAPGRRIRVCGVAPLIP